MDRRDFIRLSAYGTTAGIIAPTAVLASTASMAGGVYYTKDAPGRWSKKVAGHLPAIEVSGSKIHRLQMGCIQQQYTLFFFLNLSLLFMLLQLS